MNCQQAKPLIEPYADGELQAAAILELEQHLQNCGACALAWRNLQNLRKELKQDALYFTAPAELRQRIRAELPSPGKTTRPWGAWSWNWLNASAAGAAAVCLALLLSVLLARPSLEQQLAGDVVASHIRSLMASHALDVASSDQHTVKPWFNGKLDFSPPVKDLAAQGFPLSGGRLDYVGGRSVAALVFQRQKHLINLFIWPAKEARSNPAVVPPSQGYHLVRWIEGGMSFWATSDLNEKELMEFVQDFRAEAQSPGSNGQ